MTEKEKTTYHGFKVGERVQLDVTLHMPEGIVDRGAEFTIMNFPPVVVDRFGFKHFVYGKTDQGQHVRVRPDSISKIRKGGK